MENAYGSIYVIDFLPNLRQINRKKIPNRRPGWMKKNYFFLRWVQFYACIYMLTYSIQRPLQKEKKNFLFSTSCVWSFFWLFNSQRNSFAIFFSFLLLVTFLIEFRTVPNFSQMQTSKNHLWIWYGWKGIEMRLFFCVFVFLWKRDEWLIVFYWLFITFLRLSTTLIKWWIVGC